jgi:hypothetical protein
MTLVIHQLRQTDAGTLAAQASVSPPFKRCRLGTTNQLTILQYILSDGSKSERKLFAVLLSFASMTSGLQNLECFHALAHSLSLVAADQQDQLRRSGFTPSQAPARRAPPRHSQRHPVAPFPPCSHILIHLSSSESLVYLILTSMVRGAAEEHQQHPLAPQGHQPPLVRRLGAAATGRCGGHAVAALAPWLLRACLLLHAAVMVVWRQWHAVAVWQTGLLWEVYVGVYTVGLYTGM